MKAVVIFCYAVVLVGCVFRFTDAVTPSNLWCSGATINAVRVQGCDEQPCTIVKGELLPFETDIRLDAELASADTVRFHTFISYYAVPPNAYGMDLSYAMCGEESIGFNCPITPNVDYTVKSALCIDPKAVCTAGCGNMGPDGTGLREVDWLLGIDNAGSGVAVCQFQITLNITVSN